MMVDPGQALNHRGDAVQGPQLPDEPMGGGAVQQGLLDLANCASESRGVGPLGPRLRSPSVARLCQRACQTLTAWAETSSWRATSA
jgi:hypothetical protein